MPVVYRFLGVSGMFAYAVIGTCALLVIHRHFDVVVRRMTAQHAIVLAAGLAICLAIAFIVGYPLANSGVIGPGSDRDEHVQIGATALLHGRYPYSLTGPEGNPISQMPGALLLAAPFVLLGKGAYQNLFWLPMFGAVVALLSRDLRPALLLLIIVLSLSPVVLREYVTGGDLLANAIYVLVFTIWLVRVVPEPERVWATIGAAVALGVGLSSRMHFVLVLPLLFSTLQRRAGLAAAVRAVAITCAARGSAAW
jgi:hypothetical protein